MDTFPLLKFAARIAPRAEGLDITYRGKTYPIATTKPEALAKALSLCDGRIPVAEILRQSGVDPDHFQSVLEALATVPVILDGVRELRSDGLLSGREMFWRLEALLVSWRRAHPLDSRIAVGSAPKEVVKGFCLELGYLLRQVPDELSLAIAASPTEAIRKRFMEFYEEESHHGEILFLALRSWFEDEEDVLGAVPLPATAGLLNTYRAWSSRDPLLYATALMRDEGSPLDAEILDSDNPYHGMRLHDVPNDIVDKFEWHAFLDRRNDHGFFPLEIFSEFDVISRSRARSLISALRQIVELHDLFRTNIEHYYGANAVDSRLRLYEPFERDVYANSA